MRDVVCSRARCRLPNFRRFDRRLVVFGLLLLFVWGVNVRFAHAQVFVENSSLSSDTGVVPLQWKMPITSTVSAIEFYGANPQTGLPSMDTFQLLLSPTLAFTITNVSVSSTELMLGYTPVYEYYGSFTPMVIQAGTLLELNDADGGTFGTSDFTFPIPPTGQEFQIESAPEPSAFMLSILAMVAFGCLLSSRNCIDAKSVVPV